jgi:hypothetical protein
LFNNTVIVPKQNQIVDFYQPILRAIEGSSKLYYIPFTPIGDAEPDTTVEMKMEETPKVKVLSDEEQDWLNAELDGLGEDESELLNDGFACVAEDDCEGDDGLSVDFTKIEMLAAWGVNPDNLSKYDVEAKNGEGVWLVRYQYDLAKELKKRGEPAIIDTSRKFCTHQIDSAKNGNRVYKREVLENLNNPEFGSYNIFWYKGSYNCRHVWKRKLYFKSYDTDKTSPVGNVPYVTKKTNDKRATTKNKPVKR